MRGTSWTRGVLAAAWLGVCGAAGAPAWAVGPTLESIPDRTIRVGSTEHLVLSATDPEGRPLTFTAVSSVPVVQATVRPRNRTLRVPVQGFGVMEFFLFEDLVPRATSRIIQLANTGFYDGLTFHRVLDNFVIQGGDPTGNGSGGSDLPDFDDHFHVDLQHNRTGMLSMAKAGDDTNNSQFFITEGSQRHLDGNHSVFGVLTVGENVREAISEVAVLSGGRPVSPVRMGDVSTYRDETRAVLSLKGVQTGSSFVTVTVRDAEGLTAQRVFSVTVLNDIANAAPWLRDPTPLRARPGQTLNFSLGAVDVEGDAPVYAAAGVSPDNDDWYTLNATTGAVTVRAPTGFTGVMELLVGVRQNATSQTTPDPTNGQYAWDRQVLRIEVAPNPAPDKFEGGVAPGRDNTPAGAVVQPTGGAQRVHSLHTKSDQDWVKFTLAERSNVVIRASGADGKYVRLRLRGPNSPTAVPTSPQTVTAVWGAGYTQLTRTGDRALAAGTWWVRVDGQGQMFDGYRLAVTATPVE